MLGEIKNSRRDGLAYFHGKCLSPSKAAKIRETRQEDKEAATIDRMKRHALKSRNRMMNGDTSVK